MKKIITILGYTLSALLTVLPVGTALTSCFNLVFELRSYCIFAIVTALLAIALTIISFIHKTPVGKKHLAVIFAASAPLSLVNAVFFIFKCGYRIDDPLLLVTAISMLLCIISCCCLSSKHGKPIAFKITAMIISLLLLIPIIFLSFMFTLFDNISEDTVIKSVDSPSGKYCAQLIDNNQGALGGATLVKVYSNRRFEALTFTISKKPQTVHIGPWNENIENIDIYWDNDEFLYVGSEVYDIENKIN